MRILVTNDDGIYSPGLVALARAAAEFGRVRVVAPDAEQSSVGHSITLQRPLHYRRTRLDDIEAYHVDGTPADCVALGLYHWDGADLVLSGVNLGSNLGHEIWHSGTVAGARQAALLGVPAAAFSLVMGRCDPAFDDLAPWLARVLRLLVELPRPFLVNVNLPPEPRGMRWTRQSVRAYSGRVVEGTDPMGRKHYWFAASPQTEPEEGTDRWVVHQNLIALVPLRLDLTDEARLSLLFSTRA